MDLIQGIYNWKLDKTTILEVVVLSHGNDNKSSVLLPNGTIQRVSTKKLKKKIEQYDLRLT